MTFCLGIRVKDGLVALADTRVTTGNEVIVSRKVSTFHSEKRAAFIMTSGLRSVRDKAVTYFDEAWSRPDPSLDRLFKVVNLFAAQVRRVADEDRMALERSGFQFNMHALIGGQMEKDAEHKLYLVYPQGNWVDVSEGTPYFVIGETAYGKPLLDRALGHRSTLEEALKIGYLAFDATRTSATDVDFPLDVVVYRPGTYEIVEHRFEHPDLAHVSAWWNSHLKDLIHDVPSGWVGQVLSKPSRGATVTPIPLHPLDS